jgi:hypothetical protein
MFLLISEYLVGSITRWLGEPSDVLIHYHGSLLQMLKLLLLELDHTLGNMVSSESNSELWPVNNLWFLMHFYISIPPVGCKS